MRISDWSSDVCSSDLVGFEEVADAAGVSRSLVYNYFGDRAGLTAAVYIHEVEQLDQQLRRAADGKLPVEVRLRRIVRRYLVFARDNPDVWNLITSIGSLPHPAIQEARRSRLAALAPDPKSPSLNSSH